MERHSGAPCRRAHRHTPAPRAAGRVSWPRGRGTCEVAVRCRGSRALGGRRASGAGHRVREAGGGLRGSAGEREHDRLGRGRGKQVDGRRHQADAEVAGAARPVGRGRRCASARRPGGPRRCPPGASAPWAWACPCWCARAWAASRRAWPGPATGSRTRRPRAGGAAGGPAGAGRAGPGTRRRTPPARRAPAGGSGAFRCLRSCLPGSYGQTGILDHGAGGRKCQACKLTVCQIGAAPAASSPRPPSGACPRRGR